MCVCFSTLSHWIQAPEEIRDDFDVEEHAEREAERRREYEEENLMRTSVVKKKKKKSKHNRDFDDMDDFDDLAAFLDERDANDGDDELQKLREQKRTQKRTKAAEKTVGVCVLDSSYIVYKFFALVPTRPERLIC